MGAENIDRAGKAKPKETRLIKPTEQLRPLLATLLMRVWDFRDGFYAHPMVHGREVEVSSYQMYSNPSVFKTDFTKTPREKVDEKGITEGWGTISVSFDADPEERDGKGREISSYTYTFVTPSELLPGSGGIHLATIFQTSFPEVWRRKGEAELEGKPVNTAEELRAILEREDIDLNIPVVIATTHFVDDNTFGIEEVLDERTDVNADHFDRLQALYNLLENI